MLHSAAPSATKKRGLTPTLSPSTPIPPSISICFSLVCVCISFHKKPYMFWEHKSTDYFVLFLHLFLSQRSFNINVTIDNMFFHIAYYQTFRFLLLWWLKMVFHCSFSLYFFLLVMNVPVSLYIKGCLIPFSEICLYFFPFFYWVVGLFLIISRSSMKLLIFSLCLWPELLNTLVRFVNCLLTLLIMTFAFLILPILL